MTAAAHFEPTPIEIGGVLYAPDGVGLAEAFDATTGRTIWVQRPFTQKISDVAGLSTRGVAYWKGRSRGFCDARIFDIHNDSFRREAFSAPMTYPMNGKQCIVVAVSAPGKSPEWVALGL